MADQNAGAQTPTEAPGEGKPAAGTAEADQGTTVLTESTAPAPAGDAPKEGNGEGKPGDDGKPPAGAPEKYELALPEGVTLDESAFTEFEPVLRELNLSNEQASKLAGVFAKMRQSDADAGETAHQTQVEAWGKQTRADAELGGEAFESNVKAAQRAIAAFATPELKSLLDSTGLGNHPEVVRFCLRIGKSLSEDTTNRPPGAGGGERSLAERLYGNS